MLKFQTEYSSDEVRAFIKSPTEARERVGLMDELLGCLKLNCWERMQQKKKEFDFILYSSGSLTDCK